jgi:predicted nucleotidyltransferase|uniref:DNA polymerase subunit beta n=1 Tax=Ignisphaera aggregans TaxID=334771 RepID=A0A7J2U2D5_9CREN
MTIFEGYVKKIVYDDEKWALLRRKRESALRLMLTLKRCGIVNAVVHGSIARGDVEEDSDIDVSLLKPYSPGLLELCLERSGYSIYSKVIVMPTPIHTPKIYIYLDSRKELAVSNPLAELNSIEIEFYRFSGMIELKELIENLRVSGVNKKLMLIEPTSYGHIETPVIGNEHYVARKLKVSLAVVRDRVEALMRRAREGHTGLFIEQEVSINMDTEMFVRRLCNENKVFRERLQRYDLCT